MGIAQSDIIIREAVRAGLREIRETPEMIDDIFSELLEDPLSNGRYGDLTIAAAREWLTNTKITVKLGLAIVQADLPCISIALLPTSEAESTLSDLDLDATSEVDPDGDETKRKRYGLYSAESYGLGVFCHGEPEHALFLYSILMYTLLKNKFRYLDQRGFIISTVQSGPLQAGDFEMENVFTRSITLNGKVRHVWYDDWDGGKVTDIHTNTPPTVPEGKEIISLMDEYALLADKDVLAGYK